MTGGGYLGGLWVSQEFIQRSRRSLLPRGPFGESFVQIGGMANIWYLGGLFLGGGYLGGLRGTQEFVKTTRPGVLARGPLGESFVENGGHSSLWYLGGLF